MKTIQLTQTTPLYADQNGALRLAGSRVLLDLVVSEFNQGATAEQIQDSYPSLSLQSIYGAIAFYLERHAEVDEYLRTRETEAEALRQQIETRPEIAAFRERLRHRRAQMQTAA